MILYNNLNKEGNLLKIFIKICAAFIVIYNFLMVFISFSKIDSKFTYNENLLNAYNIAGFTISIISIFCCIVFYYMYKENFIFNMIFIYLFMSIEYLFINLYIEKQNMVDYATRFLFVLFLFRAVLNSFIIFKDKKVVKKLLNHKFILIISMFIIAIIVYVLEIYFEGKFISFINLNLISWATLFITFYLYIVVYKSSKISIEQNKFIYVIFALSINIFIFRKLQYVMILFGKKTNLMTLSYMNILGFSVIIIGLFIEMILRVKESERLRFELDVFFNAIEKDKQNNIVIYDDKFNIRYANKLTRDMAPTSYEPIKSQSGYLKKTPLYANCKDLSDGMKKSIEKYDFFKDYAGVHKNRYYEADIQKIRVNNKEMIISSFTDITEKHLAIEKLRKSEESLKGITENILDFILKIDSDGIITYVNKATLLALKCKEEDVLYKNYTIFLEDNSKEEILIMFLESEETESALIEHKITYNYKDYISVETIIKKLLNKDGSIESYIVVCRNSNVRKELEKLTKKYKEMKELDELRTEFFANLSHEVRTPINIIYSCLQLLNNEKEKGNEKFIEYYEKYSGTIRENCFRILRLVNNIIDVSRYETINSIIFSNEDIVRIVEDVTLSVVPFVEGRSLNIMFDTSIEELQIKCNAEDIERLMLNIISNSVKFTGKGGEIFVDLDYDKDFVYIRVKDNGIGIPKDLQERVFERFLQSDKSLNRKNEGSGIGLALVKSIASLHNGKVYVESSNENGTVFTFEIPNIKMDEEDIYSQKIVNDKSIKEKVDIEFSDIYDK